MPPWVSGNRMNSTYTNNLHDCVDNHPLYTLFTPPPLLACADDHDIVNINLTSSYRGQIYIGARKSSFLVDTGSTFNLVSHRLYNHLIKINCSVSFFHQTLHIQTGNGIVHLTKPRHVSFPVSFPGSDVTINVSAIMVSKISLPTDLVCGQSFLQNANMSLSLTSNQVEKPTYQHLFTKTMLHLRQHSRCVVVDLVDVSAPPAFQGSIYIVPTNSNIQIVNNRQEVQPFQRRFTLELRSKLPSRPRACH